MPNIITNIFGEEIIVKTEEELEKENQLIKYDIFKDVLSSLNFKTKHLFLEDPIAANEAYKAYIINLCFSYVDKFGKNDSILYANEINIRPWMDARLQYDIYFHGLTKRARFGKGVHGEDIENLELISEYYSYSMKKAKEALEILTTDQIEIIKNKMSKGKTTSGKSKKK